MRKRFHHGVTRAIARTLTPLCLLLWTAPPAAAFRGPVRPHPAEKTQTPSPELRKKIAAREKAAAQPPDVRELSDAEMAGIRGRGQYRNRAFSGVLPWQRSLRDVNLCNGNLFKSFTDLQVSPARGAGLAFQRSYNSNDERVGPFGVGWTHAYDLFTEEAGNNVVERVDFFGGEHAYTRDADGLYSPPPYLHDELSSEYENFLVNGPTSVLSDEQRGMDGTVKHFFKNGDVRSCDYIEDRHGNRTVLTYGLTLSSGKKLLTRVTDPSGRYLELSWINLGTQQAPAYRISQVQGPFDPQTSQPVYTVAYEYNAEGNLWKVHQDPNGLNRTTTYTYATVSGESGLLASISDPLGHTVSYQYSTDINNGGPENVTGTLWVSQITEPGSGGNHVWTLWTSGVFSSNPWVFSVQFSSNALPYYQIGVDASLRATMFSLEQASGLVNLTYDSSNNLIRRVGSSGPLYDFDGTNDPDDFWNGVIEDWTYGPHGNLLTHSYEGFPNVATTYSYYNASKYFQKESVTDPNGKTTTFDYFDKNDPSPGNRGQVKWMRDARYSVTGEQFEYTYNGYGQKLTETNLNDVVTECTYGDTWGNLTQVVQDPGTGKLNRTTTMSYDVAGRVLSSTDPKNQTSSFTYNAVGQPLQATLPGETVSYTYGANGRTASATDGRGTTTITYETGNDRVQSVTDPVTGTVSYTYGLAGERKTLSLPGGGTWTYRYAPYLSHPSTPLLVFSEQPDKIAPLLQQIEDDQGRTVDYSINIFGTLHAVRNNKTVNGGGGLTSYQLTRYEFDAGAAPYSYTHGWTRRVKSTWHSLGMMGWQSQVLVQNDYTYDNAGNRLTNTISDSSGPVRTETYGYDALSRLTSVNYGDGQAQGYTFDAMGNRLTKTDNVAGNDSYTYNAANMLLTRNGGSYTNDANGNTLTGGGRTNTWDGQNRLTQCVFSGTTTTHTYGADGLRRRTVEGLNTTDYILDNQSVVRTFKNSAVDRTFLHGPRGPEYERLGANDPVWYLYDGTGSVLGTVDKIGNLVSTRKYDVYGAVRGSTGPSGPKHKWVGSLGHPSEDETGLVYMRARYYDPVLGRFSSQDPIRHGSNWINYCRSNPVNFVDPDGKAEFSLSANLTGMGVLGFLGGFMASVLVDLANGNKINLLNAFIAGAVGAVFAVLMAVPAVVGTVGASVLGAGRALLVASGQAMTVPGIGGLLAVGAAILGLTALAGLAMQDDDQLVETNRRLNE